MKNDFAQFAPLFQSDTYSEEETYFVSPFFTNLEKPVYAPLIFSPELIGALCSRTSRAAEDLRRIYLKEFIYPFVKPVNDQKESDEEFDQKVRYGNDLKEFIEFLHKHPVTELFSNPRARSFYIRWLAQYGDDSIAQMAGSHLVFSALSQVAIKHFEDQRIGLAPIEKSTRYVNYSNKINGSYLYYTDPTLKELGLKEQYRAAMDGLFETYKTLLPKLAAWLQQKFPQEKASVVEKKAFDTLRGLLPNATLSQVAFFGNGQAFEYLITRSARHPLGEIRWAAEEAYEELYKVTPSFLRRIKDGEKKAAVEEYQHYIAAKGERVAPHAENIPNSMEPRASVKLVEYDPEGEHKVIAAMLYSASGNHSPWEHTLAHVRNLDAESKERIIADYMRGRTQRWQKVGRAFENAYNRFEIAMNIGAWRDLHRHRMLTQQKQHFSCIHGFDTPPEIEESGLGEEFSSAIKRAEDVYALIEAKNKDLAQYAVTMAHRLRFMQWENLRQSFWQIELRSIPEGHPDYRHVAQEKFRQLEKIYPLLAKYMHANMGEYDFARRGQEEKIQKKAEELSRKN